MKTKQSIEMGAPQVGGTSNKTIPLYSIYKGEIHTALISQEKYKDVQRYYEVAGNDYEFWSKKFNMHFGYYKPWMNPFKREPMLNEMNEKVLDELQLSTNGNHQILDLGCGMGTTVRHACKKFPHSEVVGVTIVPSQVKKANELTEKAGLEWRASFLIDDYTCLPFAGDSMDAVYAIESSCYAIGNSRDELFSEMFRVMKPSTRFVIADGFLKQPIRHNGFLNYCYKKMCESWALTELPLFGNTQRALERAGFKNIKAEDISWKVAPSFAHVPFVVLQFLFKQFFNGTPSLADERKGNLLAPLMGMVTGLHRNYFGYYLITGEK